MKVVIIDVCSDSFEVLIGNNDLVVISEGVESFQQLRDDITENNAYHIKILDLRGMAYYII